MKHIKEYKLFELDTNLEYEWHDAIVQHNIEKIKRMISEGVDVNMEIDSTKGVALHYAVRHENILKILVKVKDIDLDSKDFDNNTALSFAGFNNNMMAIFILLDAGANFKLTDGDNKRYFFDYLNPINKEELFSKYPEINNFVEKQKSIKKFKI